MDKKVLTYWGENYWGRPVYQLQGKEKYYADLGNQNQHDLHTLSPINDPDGEPDMRINPEKFIIVPPQEPKKSREEQKFILAKMIAANEYKEGKTSVEWINLASSIKDLNLTKELLKELKEQPMELMYVSGHGWLEKKQADALEILSDYQLDSDKKFRYQMLSRMQSDCEYYLGYGNRSSGRLWAHNEKKQLEIMKALYNSFHDWEKPEWISMEKILEYESQMLVIGTEGKSSLQLRINNNMTMVLDNRNDEDVCLISLVDNNEKILWTNVVTAEELYELCLQRDVLTEIEHVASDVRNQMESDYGEDLQGKCMEASERIVEKINDELHIKAKTVEGWCKFDNESFESNHPWDMHIWVEVPLMNLYVDITADQFNGAMRKKYPKILVQKGLPHGMQYEEPSWNDFEYN